MDERVGPALPRPWTVWACALLLPAGRRPLRARRGRHRRRRRHPMTPFVLLAAALGLVAVLGVTRPLWWPAPKAASDGAPPRRSPWLAPLLGVFVFAVAAVGYYGIGAPGALALHPGAPRPVEAGASAPTMEQIVAIVDKALKDNPRNPRALTLAGAIAYDRGDYALAVRHWETLAQVVPPDDPQL